MLIDTLGRKNRTIPDKTCEHCGIGFRPKASKHRTCSRKCGYAIRKGVNDNRIVSQSWWKNSKGYVEGFVRVNGEKVRVKQHRYFMEQHLGRKLLPTEDVHHINSIKDDNRIENLQVIDHTQHTIMTHKGRKKATS